MTILCDTTGCVAKGCGPDYCALGAGLVDYVVRTPLVTTVTWDIHIGDPSPEFARALGIPDPLDTEREELANDRAARQTLAWRYGKDEHGQPLPTPADPTAILDADDPWQA